MATKNHSKLCRPVCSEARYSSRIAIFAYPTCNRWGFPLEYRHLFGMEKLEWLSYPMVKQFRRYLYSF